MDRPISPWLGYAIVFGAIWLIVTLAYVRNRLWVRRREREGDTEAPAR
ncbi:MAG: hypothetical protein U9Q74_05445 [Gemmatimonadota bacterium]|nr:hypothetical protein [Gemmatimonadota bacterium]